MQQDKTLRLIRLAKRCEIYSRWASHEDCNATLMLKRIHRRGVDVFVWFEIKASGNHREIDSAPTIELLYKEREATLDGSARPCA